MPTMPRPTAALPFLPQGRLDASVLDQVKQATSPDVHHATGAKMQPRWGLSCTRETLCRSLRGTSLPQLLKHAPARPCPQAWR